MTRRSHKRIASYAAATLVATLAQAATIPEPRPVDSVLMIKPELIMRADLARASQFAALVDDERFERLGVRPEQTMVDRRTGRLATLYPATPLLPGRGVGNNLSWAAGAPQSAVALEQAAGAAFRAYVVEHAADLGVAIDELAWPGKVAALDDDLVNIHIPRVVAGIAVRHSNLSASIRHGNLILLGTDNWGDFDGNAIATLTMDEARESLKRYVGDGLYGAGIRQPWLEFVPVTTDDGSAITYRLAWVLLNDLQQPGGRFEALVDAGNGELLSLQDDLHYGETARRVQGGVYPVSNDQTPPDGVEQAGWPMPFAQVTSGGSTFVTDVGGNTPSCLDGEVTTVLSGPYVDMADVCGAESLASSDDEIDWLSGPTPAATDCTTPGVGGPGNTKASRTGFHELNMLKAMARSQLPSNNWLHQQLTANMNIVNTCNAFWNGTSVNFYRAGGGCRNTGEQAAIFDHEWGHGMDNNDAVPSVSSPGEGVADTYSTLRLNDSCIGRGFRVASNCGGYGDPCLDCTGVRDVDWAKRASGLPHDILWIDANCGSGPAPCGGGVHCEGSVYAESLWDLWNRDLTGGTFNYTLDRAREVAAHLAYRGATAVGSQWYTCDTSAPHDGGCGATTGYQKYLAADDDNGNLADGTPHMTAIYAAFNRTKIACQTITPVDSGCTGMPTVAPTVTATARDRGVELSWGAVPSAVRYDIYRTDGVFGCAFGKIKVASTTDTGYVDSGLQNGREYSYIVIPVGSTADMCLGPASSCSAATPSSAAPSIPGLTPLAGGVQLSVAGGDGDDFLDNCEQLRVTVPLANSGGGALSNVRVVSIASPSHPTSVGVGSFPQPVTPELLSCGSADAVVEIQPRGLASGDPFDLEIEFTADELAEPAQLALQVTIGTEGDFQLMPTQTWTFESGPEGWTTEEGTFVRSNSGAGTPGNAGFFYQSSQNLANQCDVVASPVVRLTPTSTLSISNHFDIEPFSGSVWYDRANLAFRVLETGAETTVSPSSGRTYNASGANGTCETTGEPGWAGAAASWAASNWTSDALQTGALGGLPGKFVFRYGTDPGLHLTGFRFDTFTLNDTEIAVADPQGDTCSAPVGMPFLDGFESGNTSEWSNTQP